MHGTPTALRLLRIHHRSNSHNQQHSLPLKTQCRAIKSHSPTRIPNPLILSEKHPQTCRSLRSHSAPQIRPTNNTTRLHLLRMVLPINPTDLSQETTHSIRMATRNRTKRETSNNSTLGHPSPQHLSTSRATHSSTAISCITSICPIVLLVRLLRTSVIHISSTLPHWPTMYRHQFTVHPIITTCSIRCTVPSHHMSLTPPTRKSRHMRSTMISRAIIPVMKILC
mmetsp:Transcript_10534/g.39160  ORF Transcript_10534/g.39160 Transcript_10534/m.39160 type:complete len:225 (+) Transcript_10534:1100-1774(+)